MTTITKDLGKFFDDNNNTGTILLMRKNKKGDRITFNRNVDRKEFIFQAKMMIPFSINDKKDLYVCELKEGRHEIVKI